MWRVEEIAHPSHLKYSLHPEISADGFVENIWYQFRWSCYKIHKSKRFQILYLISCVHSYPKLKTKLPSDLFKTTSTASSGAGASLNLPPFATPRRSPSPSPLRPLWGLFRIVFQSLPCLVDIPFDCGIIGCSSESTDLQPKPFCSVLLIECSLRNRGAVESVLWITMTIELLEVLALNKATGLGFFSHQLRVL